MKSFEPCAPRVWDGPNKWKWHNFQDLLEVANHLMSSYYNGSNYIPLLTPEELWKRFIALSKEIGDGIPRLNWSDKPDSISGGCVPDFSRAMEIYVPAGWGDRVVYAIRSGALRADVKPKAVKKGVFKPPVVEYVAMVTTHNGLMHEFKM